jgi:acetyltransferase
MASMVRFGQRIKPRARWPRVVLADCASSREMIETVLNSSSRKLLHQHQANQLLGCYNLPLLPHRLVTREEDLDQACHDLGFPLVMKVVSPQIVHKSDAGGVKLNLASRSQVEKAYKQIMQNAKAYDPKAEVQGVYLERMAESGVEVIIGAFRDPKFGPLVMFGLGGTLVEVMGDVTFRLAPMWESSAENMIKGIKAYKVLEGVRGRPPADVDAIKDCILKVSQMMDENPEIAELDINPLIVHAPGQGCTVADCRVVLSVSD